MRKRIRRFLWTLKEALLLHRALLHFARCCEKNPKFKLSMGLEFSHVVDWCAHADVTPRAHHPKARRYGEVWHSSGTSPAKALNDAIQQAEAYFENPYES